MYYKEKALDCIFKILQEIGIKTDKFRGFFGDIFYKNILSHILNFGSKIINRPLFIWSFGKNILVKIKFVIAGGPINPLNKLLTLK